MELYLLNKKELSALYRTSVTRDFPPSERKPLSAMLRLMDRGRYEPLSVREDGKTVGYALMWLAREGGLLDYLAVESEYRNAGLGGQILRLLGERYACIFGEAEAPDHPDEAVNRLRRRRLDFYRRNGLRVLNYDCALFGVHYKCLYLGREREDADVLALHREVYESWFSPLLMKKFIRIPLAEGELPGPACAWTEEPGEEKLT